MLKSRFIATSGIKMVVSMLVVCLMALSLVGCGDNTAVSGQQSKITTEEMSTEEFVNPVDEPNQEIDPGVNLTEASTEEVTEVTTEATTEEDTSSSTITGKYSYTIYNGIQISMDTNVDDYVSTTDSGREFFKLYDAAIDLGWTCRDEGTYTKYTYDYNGFVIYFDYWCHKEQVKDSPNFENSNQIAGINYLFITEFGTGEGLPSYYGEEAYTNVLHKDLLIDVGKHYSDVQYAVPGTGCMSRDDIILVTYLFESVKHNPGENPFCFIDASSCLTSESGGNTNYYLQ